MLFKQLFSHPKSHSHLPPNRFLQAEITFTREGNHSNTYSTPLKQFLLRSDSNGTSAKHKYSFLRHQGTQSHPLYSTVSHSLLKFSPSKEAECQNIDFKYGSNLVYIMQQTPALLEKSIQIQFKSILNIKRPFS